MLKWLKDIFVGEEDIKPKEEKPKFLIRNYPETRSY